MVKNKTLEFAKCIFKDEALFEEAQDLRVLLEIEA